MPGHWLPLPAQAAGAFKCRSFTLPTAIPGRQAHNTPHAGVFQFAEAPSIVILNVQFKQLRAQSLADDTMMAEIIEPLLMSTFPCISAVLTSLQPAPVPT